MKALRLVSAAALTALLLAGCGAQGGAETGTGPEAWQPLRDLTVTLDGHEGSQNVGLLMAQKRGYFADARLSVSILSPIVPARPVQYVAAGMDDLGVTQEPQVVLAGEKGAPVVAVGSLVSQPTAAMIWLEKSHIGGIADLKGKTVAIPGVPFQKDFLGSVLAQYGLTLDDVKVENVGYELVPALVSGRADAIFGGSWNLEGVELESRGLQPIVARLRDLGVPPYDEFVVIAHPDRVSEDPRLIRDFMAAVARGAAAAIEDPRAAAEAIEEAGIADYRLSRKATEAELAATLPLLSEDGYLSPEHASGLVDWMHEEGLIERKPPVSELLTDDYR